MARYIRWRPAQTEEIMHTGKQSLQSFQPASAVEVEVVRLSPGDVFGEAELVSDAATPFKVKALTRTAVYEIAKSDLAGLLQGKPAVASELLQVLARRQSIVEERREHEASQHDGNDDVMSCLTERFKQLPGIE